MIVPTARVLPSQIDILNCTAVASVEAIDRSFGGAVGSRKNRATKNTSKK